MILLCCVVFRKTTVVVERSEELHLQVLVNADRSASSFCRTYAYHMFKTLTTRPLLGSRFPRLLNKMFR